MIDGPYRFMSLVRANGVGYKEWSELVQNNVNAAAQQGYAVQWMTMPSSYSVFIMFINVNAKENPDAKAEGEGIVTDPPATVSTEV